MTTYTTIICAPQQVVFDEAGIAAEVARLRPVHPFGAYVLEGDTHPRIALALFAALQHTATEVVWRAPHSTEGYVIFALPSDAAALRPTWVSFLNEWSESDLARFDTQQVEDTETILTADLSVWWKEAQDENPEQTFTDTLTRFLMRLYAHSPRKDEVHLTGTVPTPALLLAYRWFSLGSCVPRYTEQQTP